MFPTARLSTDLKLHANDFFNQGAMNKDLGMVRDLYGSYGFVFADIQADPRLLEDSAQLDLVYNIKEGSRYRVGKINISITGESPHTSYVTILDRLSLRPGDILDTTKLRKDERRLGGQRAVRNQRPEQEAEDRVQSAARNGRCRQATGQPAKAADRAGWAARVRRAVTIRAAPVPTVRARVVFDAVRSGLRFGRFVVRLDRFRIVRTSAAKCPTTTECRRRRST